MKNTKISNLLSLVIITFVSLLSLQACAQEPEAINALQSNKNTQSDFVETDEELNEEELALLKDDSKIKLEFAAKSLQVEFADSFDERALGLMHRKSLCENCGMLFQFDSERIASIWMKNTFVPLDLAYITVDGQIVDILPLQPHDLSSVKSSKPVLFALEMNQGWFAKNDINVGDKVSIEGRIKQPSFMKKNN